MEKATNDFTSGSHQALKEIMQEYGPALLRYCHNILCDYHEAQDALQMTFIKAYEKRASFKNGAPISPWLYKIAYTTCIDILRRKKFSLVTPEPVPGPEVQEDEGYIPDNIREALMTLTVADRALVFGRVIEERSYDELSDILGKNAAALRKRYERARRKLMDILRDDYPYYAKKEQSK